MKIYQELGSESLQNRSKLRKLSLFHKIYKDQSPLYDLIPGKTPDNYPLKNIKEIPIIKVKYKFFEKKLFPATLTGWNDLEYSLCNAPSINAFKKNFSKFICLGPNNNCNIYSLHLLKLLTRLCLSFNHLRCQKFKYNFSYCLDKTCMCRKISNLQAISSSNIPYFLKEGKSS